MSQFTKAALTIALTMTMTMTMTMTVAMTVATGCGGNEDASGAQSLGGTKYAVLESTTLTTSADSLSGTGKIVVSSPLSGTDSGASFTLSFSLNDGGSLKLVTFATDQLQSGFTFVFTRSGSQLQVLTRTSGGDANVTGAFSSVNASGPITLVMDVHNNESPAHALAGVSEATALFNSENEDQPGWESTGKGSGKYWGLELSGATVTRAETGAPKFTVE